MLAPGDQVFIDGDTKRRWTVVEARRDDGSNTYTLEIPQGRLVNVAAKRITGHWCEA